MPGRMHPLLYEINTRCWLGDLADRAARHVTLAGVPEEQFADWRRLGFTHIWLMGVWATGPLARSVALSDPARRTAYSAALADWRDEDVAGSPYAIAEYRVPAILGGDEGLEVFRQQLHRFGLRLILDFVPNHVGLDHPWIRERPGLFVQGSGPAPEVFARETAAGVRWLAHGKDPNFPAWTETAQLDYRRASTRRAMIDQLNAVARRCDGVRCDMAMLQLNDVFDGIWRAYPVPNAGLPEFWPEAISEVRQRHPEFLLVAEAYWGLEPRLQDLGFDFVYDKEFYDRVMAPNGAAAVRHLLGRPPTRLAGGVHFLENHDEERAAAALAPEPHRAAALLMLALPGMRLLHEGQLAGAKVKTPVQLLRRSVEPLSAPVASFYDWLLTALSTTAVGCGRWKLLRPRAAWAGNPTAENLAVIQWQSRPPGFDLAVINLAPHRSQCRVALTVEDLNRYQWRMADLLGEERYVRAGGEIHAEGLFLDLASHAAQLFHFDPQV